MTLIDDDVATEAADALQAAYFRASLNEERQHLLAEIDKRRDDIIRRAKAGRGSTTVAIRVESDLRSAEAQLRYLDRLIARLDRRFASTVGLTQFPA